MGPEPDLRPGLPLKPEFAVVSTLLLIAAPVVLVGGTMVLALAKRLTRTRPSP